MKTNRAIIWSVIVMLLILVSAGPVVFVGRRARVTRKIQGEVSNDTPATRLNIKIDYGLIASQAVAVPITWGFVNSAESAEGIGLELTTVKRAFPHDKSIQVVLAGTAFYKENSAPIQSDAEVRVALSVIPKDGWLSVTDVSIDAIRVFDFSDSIQAEFLQSKENITVEMEKRISTKLMEIPAGIDRIYEMTNEQIVFIILEK